jgi:iron complex transport system substrate-binding protein
MRRWLTGVAVLGVLLPACGGDDEDTAAPEETETAEADEASADQEPPEGRGIVTENDDGTRTVVSAYGEAVMPAEPARIVSVLGDIDFEAMLALGVTPVGAGTQGGTVESGFAPHLEGLTDGIEPIAWADGAPAEAIAALRPDLIFAPDADTADVLDDVAPVVPSGSWWGPEWKDDFLYVGEVLGFADEAEARLADYEDRAADLAEELAPVVDGGTFLSPQVSFDHANVFVDPAESFSSVVLQELGLEPAPLAVGTGGEDLIEVSFEQLERLDADLLFWQVRQADDGSPDTQGIAVARSNPLFATLPGVAADRLFEVPNRPWYFPTILGAERILDDVEAALLER